MVPEVQSGLALCDEELRTRFARVEARCQIRPRSDSQDRTVMDRIVIDSFLHKNTLPGLSTPSTLNMSS